MTIVLTEPNPELAKQIRNTPNGMAHWAGTGPEGKTCKACIHHGTVHPRDGETPYSHIPYSHIPYSNRCKLYQQRANGRVGGKVPGSTSACKYYQE